MTTALPAHVGVAVVGGGFAGLGTAVRLRQEGVTDFVLLERGPGIGGTWRDNTYPGCACDVPSHLYSFSFAPNPDWSRSFSPQPEIHAYLERVAREQGVLPHCRFGVELEAADWDDAAGLWRLRTSAGDLTAQVVVAGCGGLVEPRLPDTDGLAGFEGAAFHSARWDHDVELAGKRVVVVGTGASAIQFVPHVQRQAAHVTVLQRTPPWVLPRRDRQLTAAERAVYRHVPGAQKVARGAIFGMRELNLLAFTGKGRMRALAEKQALQHLASAVPDPALRAVLTPDYRIGCKRVLLSNDYYPALAQDNVTVVPHALERVLPHGVVAADGSTHEADVLVFGTGFQVMDIPVAHRLTGRTGQTLADVWGSSPQAHRGTTVSGFPNLFVLLGPNTALGHSSVVLMIESQIAYVMAALRSMSALDASSVEVREAAQQAWDAQVQQGLTSTVWAQGGCKAWYTNDAGRNFTLWPTHTYTFRSLLSRFDAESYEVRADRPTPSLETV